MGTLRRVSFVAVAMVLLPIGVAVASEPVVTGTDVESRDAPEEGRADEMAAWSVDSGGGESSGGDFTLTAAIGQPDAGVLSQGDTVLAGGLWAGVADLGFVFGDGFESNSTGAWASTVGGTKLGET